MNFDARGPHESKPILVRGHAIVRLQLVVVATLVLVHVATGLAMSFGIPVTGAFAAFRRLFSLLAESSFPATFSTLNLAFAAMLAWIAATTLVGRGRLVMKTLSLLLLVAAFDESVSIHENIPKFFPGVSVQSLPDIFYFSWPLYVGPPAILLGLFLAWQLRHVPHPLSYQLLAWCGLFLISALGLELLESYLAANELRGRFISTTLEELGEMIAIVGINASLLQHLESRSAVMRFASASASG